MQNGEINFSDRFFSIPVSQDLAAENSKGAPLRFVEGLSRVNTFVGPNNSGKSRLIRSLIKKPLAPYYFSQRIKDDLFQVVAKANDYFFHFVQQKYSQSVPHNIDFSLRTGNFLFDQNFFSELFKFKTEELYYIDQKIKFVEGYLSKVPENASYVFESSFLPKPVTFQQQELLSKDLIQMMKDVIDELKMFQFDRTYTRIYIPAIRSLKQLSANSQWAEKVSKEYGFEFNLDIGRRRNEILTTEKTYKSIEIQTGEGFYLQVQRAKNTSEMEEEKIHEFESFLSKEFFENKIIRLKADSDINELSIRIGNEDQRPIYDLGDGLQMLINLTFPLFNYDCGIIAIEEPELFIHPGLQKKLLEVYISHPKSKNFVFLIATHSNHLLDATLSGDNISIFTISKKLTPKKDSNKESTIIQVDKVAHQNNNALSLLGVNNSSVYLSNCTIWVEGITDKLYIVRFLSAYLAKYSNKEAVIKFARVQEGIHYSFVFSGGSTIVHWNFDELGDYASNSEGKIIASKLCGSAMVIVDNDYNKNKIQKKKLEQQLGMRFLELKLPEIENLLSYTVIKQAIKSYPSCNIIGDNEFVEPKTSQLLQYKLGSLIEKVVLKNVTSKRKKFADEKLLKSNSITINDKVGFCNQAIQFINATTLTTEAESICEKIIDFVLSKNPTL